MKKLGACQNLHGRAGIFVSFLLDILPEQWGQTAFVPEKIPTKKICARKWLSVN